MDLTSLIESVALSSERLRSSSAAVPLPSRRNVLREYARRRCEARAMYAPLPLASRVHASTAKWRVLVGSNRSSKTLTAALEFVRAHLACDPYDKYVKRNLNSLVVALSGDELAALWRKLSEPGAFKIVRDEFTRQWRSVRADPDDPTRLDPYDESVREKWRDAPPLIPPRVIPAGAVSYEDRGKGIPRVVRFPTTGSRSLWKSSEGRAPHGDHYHMVWFDEHLSNPNIYNEAIRGLVALEEPPNHRPRGIWSASGQSASLPLCELHEQALAGVPGVESFQFLIEHNPYVSADERNDFFNALNEDERQVRYFGQFATMGMRCYPTFDPQGIHGFEPQEIPPNWARYVGVDPGNMHCGSVFVAVDPNEEHLWVYDSFDLRQREADAQQWAIETKKREGQRPFEAFVIDRQMGRQTPVSASRTVAEQYFAAALDVGLVPNQQGPLGGFFPGTNDIPARQEALRGMMAIRGSGPFEGTPILKVMRGQCQKLEQQIHRAQMQLRNPEKRMKMPEDVLVCLEYLAAFNPAYREPTEKPAESENRVYEAFQKKQRRHVQRTSTQSQSYGAGLLVN